MNKLRTLLERFQSEVLGTRWICEDDRVVGRGGLFSAEFAAMSWISKMNSHRQLEPAMVYETKSSRTGGR